MRNTRNKGVLHNRIFRWNGRYIGICLESGFVEEGSNFFAVKERLNNSNILLIQTLMKSKQNLEASVNTHPPLRFWIYFHIAPILVRINSITETKEKALYDFSVSPISNLNIAA